MRHVVKRDFDEFERRASFEEGYQIPNGNVCPRRKMNRVRAGKLKSRRIVRMECNERLMSFGIRPPKIFGSLTSISVIL